MPGIPPPLSLSPSPKNPEDPGTGKGLLNFLRETKSRIVTAVMKPTGFPYSPPNNAKDGGLKNLNFPFQPVSSTREDSCDELDLSTFVDARDLELLEGKVTQLEISVNVILNEGQGENTTPINNNTKPDPAPLEGLNGILSPPVNVLQKDKIPLSIYAELIALYDQDLNGLGNGICGSGICYSTNTPPDDTPQPLSGGARTSKKKEKNLRKEVLKWNKD